MFPNRSLLGACYEKEEQCRNRGQNSHKQYLYRIGTQLIPRHCCSAVCEITLQRRLDPAGMLSSQPGVQHRMERKGLP